MPGLGERIVTSWARGVLAVWVGVFGIAALASTSSAATTRPPTKGDLAFFAALAIAFIGLAARRRWGLAASVLASVLAVALLAVDPLGDGAWWLAELAGVVFAGVLSVVGWRRA